MRNITAVARVCCPLAESLACNIYILFPAKTNDPNVLRDGKGRVYNVAIVRRHEEIFLCLKHHLGGGPCAGSIPPPAAAGTRLQRLSPPFLLCKRIKRKKNNNKKITFVIALTQKSEQTPKGG